jgi:3-methyladenine DNA glycosylase/8-oxoguanine DNA glycosylase
MTATTVRREKADGAALPFDWDEGLGHLRARDRTLGRLIDRSRPVRLELAHTQSLFHALAESIVYQQLSGKAAATIFGRVRAIYAPSRFPTPATLAATPPARLRAAGLSNAKTAAMLDLAQRTGCGELPTLAQVRRLSDDDLVERLTIVRGIGPWTVHMLLIFRLGRPDVLPVADYGVRKGFALTYRKKDLPTATELTAYAERWRPYRTLASWYMWRALDE